MRVLVALLLMCSVCWAIPPADKVKDKQQTEWRKLTANDYDVSIDQNKRTKVVGLKPQYKDYTIENFDTTLVNGRYKSVVEADIANIPEDRLLTSEEQAQIKLVLWNEGLIDDIGKRIKEGRKLIFKELFPAKNDYKHNFDRGTVHHTPKNQNYAFHKIIIPDGSTVTMANFAQKKPHTDAIVGENLTFINCNLVNVERHASWILEGCNIAQIDRDVISTEDIDGGKKVKISHKWENPKTGQFEEIQQDEEVYSGSDYADAMLRYAD